jgi:hypothetical protein
MKLVYQVYKEWNAHIDYIAKVNDTTNAHMVLPRDILREPIPYNIVAYQHTSSNNKSKHLCHKCRQLYPAFKYRQHAKESHK